MNARHRWAMPAVAALALLIGSTGRAQQGLTITGTVKSELGTPLDLARVFIESMGVGGSTSPQGKYAFIVPANQVNGQSITLTVRLIGYKAVTSQITLSGTSLTADFTMMSNPMHIGEMIVTGAGTVRAVDKLGNTINTVTPDIITRSGEQNIVTALAGKAPNVQVITQSGDPGASSYIRIRGQKTIAGTGQPLFVVDGVAIDNSVRNPRVNDPFAGYAGGVVVPNRAIDLNPDDIESVQLLKGAAAGAIYGARAGQGVVLIQTKRGLPGPTRYSLRTSISQDDVIGEYDIQRTYGLGSSFIAGGCSTPNCLIGTPSSVSFGPAITGQTYNHFDELFSGGAQYTTSLSASGGDDRTRFYLSGSTHANQGPIAGNSDAYDRYTLRLNASHKAYENVTVGANVSYVDSHGDYVQKGSNASGLLIGALRSPANFNQFPYLDTISGLQRSFRFPNPTAASATMNRGYDNPFFVINEFENTGSSNRTFGNVFAEWRKSWLSITETLGADFGQEDQTIGAPKSGSAFATGQVFRNSFNTRKIEHQLVAAADYSVSNNFEGTLTLGHALTSSRFQQVWVEGDGLIADHPFKLSNTISRLPVVDGEQRVNTDGVFGQGTADLWEQLYLTAGFRYDGSSTFSDDSRHSWFPKLAAAWAFTPHLEKAGIGRVVSYGKLRTAYGEVGEQPGAYQLLPTLVASGTFLDGGWGGSITASQGGIPAVFDSTRRGQDQIRTERTTEREAGLDLGFFDNRADLGVTYYYDLSKDVIFLLPLPPSSGFSLQAQNGARIRNTGWEVTMNVRPVKRADLDWDVGMQWGTNDNLVLSIANGVQFADQNGGFAAIAGSTVLGGRVGALRGQDFARCGAPGVKVATSDSVAFASACNGAAPGSLYIAANGFPISDATIRQVVDPQPTWTGSIQNSLRWKKLRVTALLDHQQGGEIWNGTKQSLYSFGTHKDTEAARRGMWVFGKCSGNTSCQLWMPGNEVVGPGAGKEVALVDSASGANWFLSNGGGFSSVVRPFVEKATFTKLREVSLTYTLDQPWVARKMGLSSVDVRVSGRNLVLWSGYTGLDPETNTGGAEVPSQGIDFFNNPTTRSFLFSLTLNR